MDSSVLDSAALSNQRISVFNPSSILIDTGANTNHVNNLMYFATLDYEANNIAVNMNHGAVQMTICGHGKLKYPFDNIKAFYTPDSTNSLLSEFDISKNFDWQRIRSPDGDPWLDQLVFKHDLTNEIC